MAQLNFDANTVDPNQAYDPVPAGWYNVQVTDSEMKPTSNGAGAYLQLEMTVLDGEFKGRKLFDRLNLQNQNPVAVEIAYKTLSAICHATGVIQVQDSGQLHGIPMEAKVTVRAADGQYDASNEVKGYRASGAGNGGGQAPAQGQAPMGGMPQQQAPAQQAPAQGGWQQPTQQQPAAQQQQPAGFAPQQAPAQQPANQGQQPAWGQQPQQQAPAQQEQAPQQQPQGQQAPAWGQQQPAQQQAPQDNGMATGHPTQGPAPSAGGQPGTPPWGQPQQ